MKYLYYIKGTYNRIKTQGSISNDYRLWSDMEECDDLYYHINKACHALYNSNVKEITTTDKCVKLTLENGKTKLVKKG
ncbi:hypothetical protein [Staphylococcus phage vB_SauM-V1SA19]|nr:hypothetical protein [Staphylococcus phage vB_SauM-V1SA19]